MADKLLKSITFPDLTDKYIVGDTSLSVAGAGADSKTVGDKFAGAEADLENIINASTVQTLSNNTPYLFRQTPKAGHSEFDTIVGGSVAFNQLFPPTTGATTTQGGITMTKNGDGTYTFNDTATQNAIFALKPPAMGWSVNHVLCFRGCPAGGSTNGYRLDLRDAEGANLATETGNGGLYKASVAETAGQFIVRIGNGTTVNNIKFAPQLFDLTQAFGSTVADAIYAMEQATAGSGVAYFRSLFPNAYYPYDAGELLSVSGVSAHNMVGKNLWNPYPTLRLGFTGAVNADGSFTSSTDYEALVIPITSSAYTFSGVTVSKMSSDSQVRWFLSNEYPSAGVATHRLANRATESGTIGDALLSQYRYLTALYTWGDTATKADKEKCQIEIGSTATAYEPYEIHSYPLDSTLTLRGIPKWNNGLYYDGDVYEADGTVSRKYGVVDLGTLTWFKDSRNRFATTSINNLIKPASSSSSPANMICAIYPALSANDTYLQNLGISVDTGGQIAVYDPSKASGDYTAFKNSVSGVYLVYEKATASTESAQPYQKAQICDPSGTEEYVSTSIVPVGHETDYPMTISDIAPSTNGTYTLKCTVSGGVKTYEWASA